MFFLPIMFSSYSVNTALRCLGDAKTPPMKIMIVSSIANIILDPIFMFENSWDLYSWAQFGSIWSSISYGYFHGNSFQYGGVLYIA